MLEPLQSVYIRYVNHAGKTSVRPILPIHIHFGATPWHPEIQWLLDGYDMNKRARRTFAMKDILFWSPGLPSTPMTENGANRRQGYEKPETF